jgi:hypothetical protein
MKPAVVALSLVFATVTAAVAVSVYSLTLAVL